MYDRIATWVYFSIKHGGWRLRTVMTIWKLQQWAVVSPRLLIRLINHKSLPCLYARGERVWSEEMFNKQLRDAGLR